MIEGIHGASKKEPATLNNLVLFPKNFQAFNMTQYITGNHMECH